MPQYFKEHGERLVELGYHIVPLPPGEKGPNRKGWPKFELTVQSVRKMAANGSAHDGIGILAATTPAIDVDILDEEVAQQMSDEIDRIFAGQLLMTRTGRAPKFLIPFRSDEPFRKLTSKVYSDGKHEHKVEILGDGQQWVAYHVHPDTQRPYSWFDGLGSGGIVDVGHDALPILDRESAQRVIDAFEVLAQARVAAGTWVLSSTSRIDSRKPDRMLEAGDDPFADQPVKLTDKQVDWLLSRCDASGYGDWIDGGMMLHHQYGGSAEALEKWRDWSATADNYAPDQINEKWESFGHRTDRPVTFRKLLRRFGQPPDDRPRLPNSGFVPASQFASAQRVEWHIKHVLPKRGLIVIYGEPGSSKSFFALDMVAHVARGLPWRGHKVRQANVAYIAAEGVAGFGNRLAAYAKHNEIPLDDLPVFVRGGAFELKEDYLPACDEINAIGNVGLVVIDTLAAVTPGGNENTSEDMGAAIDAAQRILEATGASVILIHHTNNQGALRGWSGLRGAVDNQVRIENKEGLRTAHIEKQKEGRDGAAYGYRLKVVELYTDEDGDAVTSCAVVENAQTAPNTRGAKKERSSTAGDFEHSRKNMHGRRYLEIITDLAGLGDANVDIDMIVEAAQNDELLNTSGERDNPTKRSITRSIDRLGEKGKIRREGRWIRLC
jgi:hypothetical protein